MGRVGPDPTKSLRNIFGGFKYMSLVRLQGIQVATHFFTGMSCWCLVNGVFNPYISRLDTSRK